MFLCLQVSKPPGKSSASPFAIINVSLKTTGSMEELILCNQDHDGNFTAKASPKTSSCCKTISEHNQLLEMKLVLFFIFYFSVSEEKFTPLYNQGCYTDTDIGRVFTNNTLVQNTSSCFTICKEANASFAGLQMVIT